MNLQNKGQVIINDEYRFSPKHLLCNYESLASDNSGRTLDGVMHIYWVFNKIRKLEIEMAPTTANVLAEIFGRVQGEEYDITYWDTLENAEKTIHCYTSNSHTDCYSGMVKNGLYTGAKFNAIEIAGELDTNNLIINPYISSASGNLTITLQNTPDSFEREGDDIVAIENTAGVTYSLSGGDLIRNEEQVS